MTKKNNVKKVYCKKEGCHKIALKYNNRRAWSKGHPVSYKYALKHRWVDELTGHMLVPQEVRRIHTLESCIKKAKKYQLISEFRTNEPQSYMATITNNWKNPVMSHLLTYKQAVEKGLLKKKPRYTKLECHKKALLCESRREFFEKYRSYYDVANKEKILDKICGHMKTQSQLIAEKCSKSSLEEIKDLVLKNNYSRKELEQKHKNLMKYVYRHKLVDLIPFKKTIFITWNDCKVRELVEIEGKKSKNIFLNFDFVKMIEKKQKSKRKVYAKVLNNKTKQQVTVDINTLIRGQNPFTKLHQSSPVYIRELIDLNLGIRSLNKNEHFKFVKINNYPKIVIQSLLTKEQKIVNIHQLKLKSSNPFSFSDFRSEAVYEIQINKLGKQSVHSEEHFKFVSKRSVKSLNGKSRVYVKIQNIKSKQVKEVVPQTLFNGGNPFNLHQDYHEVNEVQPKVKKFLLDLGLTIVKNDFDKWKSKTRPDLIVTNHKNRKIIIEVKSWKKRWFKKELEQQVKGYKRVAKKSFGNKYALTQIVCLKGKYGITLKDLKCLLKHKKLI